MENRILSLRQGRLAWFSAAMTIVLAVADALGTQIIIGMGGEEKNPIWAWFISVAGVWWIAPKLLLNAAASLLLLACWRITLARVAMAAYIVIYFAVVVLHIWLIAHRG